MGVKFSMNDKKIQCPHCDSINCFEEEVNEIKSWMCMKCGFMSNELYKESSNELKQIEMTSPNIIQDLKFYDEKRQVYWFPSIVNTIKGMIYPEGSKNKWYWAYAPVVEIPDEEKENYPIFNKPGKYHTSRLAIEHKKLFEPNDFYSALKEMGAIIELDEEKENA